MIIILLGAPSSGKGTQGEALSKILNIPHISSGNIIRKNIIEKTRIGLKVKDLINKGNYVDDKIINKMILSRIKEKDCKNGFILDGYPRTLSQAESLYKNVNIDFAINIDISEQEAVKRVFGRRICIQCNKTYHISKLDGENCPICNSPLSIRNDDKIEVVKERFKIYNNLTKCLIDFYSNLHILKSVDGSKQIQDITKDILKCIGVEDDINKN